MTKTTNKTDSAAPFAIQVSPELQELLRQKAARTGLTVDELAKHALEWEVTLADNEEPVPEPSALDREVRWLLSRTPEEIAATGDRMLKSAPPARPWPPGKTLEETMSGLWPGDETDEQILEALRELS